MSITVCKRSTVRKGLSKHQLRVGTCYTWGSCNAPYLYIGGFDLIDAKGRKETTNSSMDREYFEVEGTFTWVEKSPIRVVSRCEMAVGQAYKRIANVDVDGYDRAGRVYIVNSNEVICIYPDGYIRSFQSIDDGEFIPVTIDITVKGAV